MLLTVIAAIAVQMPSAAARPPTESLAPFTMATTNGCLYRNGRPFFWVGNGTEFGSIQSGPLNLWLAWLEGYSAVSLYPGVRLGAKRTANGDIAAYGIANPGNVLWYREAARLGFLVDFFGNAPYRHASEGVPPDILADAEFKEQVYERGRSREDARLSSEPSRHRSRLRGLPPKPLPDDRRRPVTIRSV